TTADVWTGGSRRFLGVTAHWLDSDTLERKSTALACQRFSGTHSFDAIASLLSSIHSSFGLRPDTIQATVTDNGSNFVKAFKELGIQGSFISQDSGHTADQPSDDWSDTDSQVAEMSEEFSEACEKILPTHYRCASHTLNLIASTDIVKAINTDADLKRKHESVLKKCKTLWKLLRSAKKRETLKSILGVSIQKPVITRWNLTYDCFEQLIKLIKRGA
ncbi:GSCOCG00012722001-RA-CDS, partial [Cotesia congregata]